MDDHRIKTALNNTLSGLHVTGHDAGSLLAMAKGGKKVKRKLSVAMVLVMALIVLAATAIAATLLWEKYVVQVKDQEQVQGEYAQWELSSKQGLVQSLMDMGHIPPSDLTEKLFDPSAAETQREQIADALMLALTGQQDVREINADIITYAIFGPEAFWTPAQRVWWQQVTNLYRKVQDNPDTFVLPGPGDLPEQEAIAIARKAILKAYQLPEGTLDKAVPVANLYVTKVRPNVRRWMVQFQFFKEGTANYLEKEYFAVVDPAG